LAAPDIRLNPRGKLEIEPLPHDRRIKAVAIADPCCLWFPAAAFAVVKVPVQLWASEQTNAAGSQTWRSKPNRAANRRREIVTTQAATIITDIGAI
jgi:hypothetical protein